METVDEHFSRTVRSWSAALGAAADVRDADLDALRSLFEAQSQSHHLEDIVAAAVRVASDA